MRKERRILNKTAIDILLEPAGTHNALIMRSMTGLEFGAGLKHQTVCYHNDLRCFETRDPLIVFVVSVSQGWTRRAATLLKQWGHKVILVGADSEALGLDFSGPLLNRANLVRRLLEYFVLAGRTRIASVGNQTHDINDQVRGQAFVSVGEALGLSISANDIYRADDDLVACVGRFLDNIAKYDGAICVNDMAAVEFMSQSRERVIGVPERLYVAGSGNSRLGQVVTPSLTTTTLDYFQLGVLAIDIWRLMQRYPDADRFQVSLPCELIIRESTACFPASDKKESAHEVRYAPIDMETERAGGCLARLEGCLIAGDALDISILGGVHQGSSVASLAEKLFVSQGTVHTRLKRLYALCNVQGKNELTGLLRCYITEASALGCLAAGCS